MRDQHARRKIAAVAVGLALVAAAVAGCSEKRKGDGSPANGSNPGCTAKQILDCARTTSLRDLVPAKATKATGSPIVLGMINQENTPTGSFPELSQAVQAAMGFVNDQLGGLDGHPLTLDVCNTKFSPEGSTACAQHFVEEHVPAVLGGIDVFGDGIDTLRQNGIPFVGGIPVAQQAATSPNSYQFSGGTWGAVIAFADYAARVVHAKRATIVYGDFGSITDSANYGKRTLEKLGVGQVQLVPYPIIATDLTAPLQAAAATKPDALIILAADTGCKPAFDGVKALGIKAQVFYVGACASPKIIQAAGPAETNGAIFNVEGPVDVKHPDPDAVLYQTVATTYGKNFDPIGAGTVTFRSFMNLYRVMRGLAPNDLTPAAITRALEGLRNAPSFMGHPATCDHHQLANLPALCSPQQILAQMENAQLVQRGGWIDVGKIYGQG